MFLAIYLRWEMVDYQSIPTLSEAVAYLERMTDEADTYPICVYDQHADQIAHCCSWPDGRAMTSEQLTSSVAYVKAILSRQGDIRQQIKDSAEGI